MLDTNSSNRRSDMNEMGWPKASPFFLPQRSHHNQKGILQGIKKAGNFKFPAFIALLSILFKH
jgi:hypothetical protein